MTEKIFIIPGIFVILHGLVHLLYMGHSLRYFELEKGFVWPDESWILSRIPVKITSRVAAALCIASALAFVIAGIDIIGGSLYTNHAMLVASAISSLTYFLMWNGRIKRLHTQGGIALLINLLLVIYVVLSNLYEY